MCMCTEIGPMCTCVCERESQKKYEWDKVMEEMKKKKKQEKRVDESVE